MLQKVLQRHVPPEQKSPLHVLLQSPQWALSFEVSTQAPLHSFLKRGHAAQVPFSHGLPPQSSSEQHPRQAGTPAQYT